MTANQRPQMNDHPLLNTDELEERSQILQCQFKFEICFDFRGEK